jgi:hypothetical protein
VAGLQSNHRGSPLEWISLTIASGAALTEEVNTLGAVPVAIKTPATWTAANFTFLGCEVTAGTYCDVYDDAGTEYNVAAAASRWILLNPSAFASHQFIKVRSGTTGTPVNQAGARTVILVLRKLHRLYT